MPRGKRNTRDEMPALPPPPPLMPAELIIDTAVTKLAAYERYERTTPGNDQDSRDIRELQERRGDRPFRTVRGENGWSATLFGTGPASPILAPWAEYIFLETLKELAAWWEDAVRDAVAQCPEPENGARQSPNKNGNPRFSRIAHREFRATGDLWLPPDGDARTFSIYASMDWDGKAAPTDIIWPFDIAMTTNAVAETLRDALGTVRVRNGPGLRDTLAWEPYTDTPRRMTGRHGIFEDFSGRTAGDGTTQARQTAGMQRLKPSAAWPATSHRLSLGICRGGECEYGTTGSSRYSSGCDDAWRKHSQAIFDAFREANPEVQYRDHSACVMEVQQKRHSCPQKNHQTVRGALMDHDEICRFPDGEKFIISHPYLSREGPHADRYTQALQELQAETPGVTATNAGPERSWYFPGHSSLVLIGMPAALDRVQLDFHMPTRTEPAGCVRWRAPSG